MQISLFSEEIWGHGTDQARLHFTESLQQGVLKFGAGEEKACGEHTGLITVPRSVPKVLEKGMLPEVFCESKMTSQMQDVRTNTCLRSKEKNSPKLIIVTINNSNIPFLWIIKFTDAKTLLLIG